MIRRTFAQLAAMLELEVGGLAGAAAGGVLGGSFRRHADADSPLLIEGVSTDTRCIRPGSLFVPIRGERFDGHDYIRDAVSGGAAAALWDRSVPPPDVPIPLLPVDDTLAAIQKLAASYRRQLDVRVVAITGSNGKTSTKDMLAGLLSTTYRTHKTPGNLNNHLGVPLTLLAMPEDTEMAVIEMGMSGLGEIACLSALAAPDIAIVTSVSEVHLGDLHTRERIAQAKLEIVHGLRPDGLLIYNGDNPLFTGMLAEVQRPAGSLLSFGASEQTILHPVTYRSDEAGVTFTVSDEAYPAPLQIPFLGKHQMINALGALAAASRLGVPAGKLQEGLLSAQATGMRNERMRIGPYSILNDAYKSNPTSLLAALDTLYGIGDCSGRIAVIGDMVELGEEAGELHDAIGEQIDFGRIDALITVGQMAARIAAAAQRKHPDARIVVCRDRDEAGEWLIEHGLRPGIVILLKGSRTLQLEQIIGKVRERVEASGYV